MCEKYFENGPDLYKTKAKTDKQKQKEKKNEIKVIFRQAILV